MSLKDQMTGKLNAAIKTTEKMMTGVQSKFQNQKLMFQVGVEGVERINRLQNEMRRAGMRISPMNLTVRDAATPVIDRVGNKIRELTGKAHNVAVNIKTNGAERLNRIKSSVGEAMSGAAMGMGAGMLGAAGIGYGVVNAFQSQMDFEKQMSAVKAVSGATKTEFEQLTAAAERMGATTKFTAKEAADGLYYMSMAGWDVDKQISALPSVLNLAAAGNTDLATTSDIVTDSMTGFGIKAGEMVKNARGELVETSSHYADLMATLVTKSNTDITMAGETMKYAAANVGAMFANGSLEDKMRGAEDMFLMTGMMANAGIKASQAGTTARTLFARFGSQNRNASFALQALGVDFTDEKYGGKGEVRRIRDIIGDLRKRFQEGVSPEQMLNFAEQLEGTKLHADTRRKLEGFLQSAQANGGKLAGGEMLKMSAMLSGQEGMSGLLAMLVGEDWDKLVGALDEADGAAERMSKIQLDNLAGDFTLLGSAWDAFQRSFVKGKASEGLRDFVQTTTDLISKANKLFEDGIQIGDVGELITDVITKLKNKFLQLDGVGSVLAGGALMLGMKKILQFGLKVKDTLSEWSKIKTASDFGNQIRGKNPVGGMSSVGTMQVKAGVVNLQGSIKGGGIGGRNVGNQRYVDDYYKRRQTILQGQTPTTVAPTPTPAPARSPMPSVLKSGAKVVGGAGIFSALFAGMDIYSAKTHSAETSAEAAETVRYHRQVLENLKAQGASQEQLNRQTEEVNAALAFQKRTENMNQQVERQAEYGAGGMVVGTMIGAAIGSAVPVLGTTIGAVIGGVLGEWIGSKAADGHTAMENREDGKSKVNFLEVGEEGIAKVKKHEENMQRWQNGEFGDQALAKVQQEQSEKAKKREEARQSGKFGDNGLAQAHNNLIAKNQNYQADSEAANKRHQDLLARGAELAQQRDKVNANWQKATGYNSLYGKDHFVVKNEDDRRALAAYDEDRKNKAIQSAQARRQEEQKNSAGVTKFDSFKNYADASQKQTESQNQLTQKISDLNQKASDNFKNFSIGDFLDNLFFSRASANPLESGTIPEKPADFYDPTAKTRTLANPEENSTLFNSENFSIDKILPDFNISEWFSKKFSEMQLPDFSQMWADFDISSILPDINLSEWFNEKFSSFEMPDISSIFPDFSAITAPASEAFNSISTSATEAWTTVQTAWNEVPSFFGGLWTSAEGAASTAGSAIANGINSGIGMIKSAWESLSSWLSQKISSLSSMASNAASAIGIKIGGNYKGTSYFEGGWTEVNEHGGELMILPTGTKIYPHATTQKILQREVRQKFQSDELGNLQGYSGIADNLIKVGDLSPVREAKIQEQRRQIEKNQNSSISFSKTVSLPTNNFFSDNSLNQNSVSSLKNMSSTNSQKNFGDNSISQLTTKNFQSDELGNIQGLEIPEYNRINLDDDLFVRTAKLQAQMEQLQNFESPFNFDFADLPVPNFEVPKSSETTNNTTTNNTTPTLNFGDVRISNGMDFDEFVHKLQQSLTQSAANSAQF